MPRNAQSGNEETVHLERLASLSSEYREVLAKIHCTHKTLVIRSIDRVQNPVLYQAYQVRKKKMDRDNGTRNNERQLFHGTAAQNVPKINTQGFNRSFAGSNGTLQIGPAPHHLFAWLLPVEVKLPRNTESRMLRI